MVGSWLILALAQSTCASFIPGSLIATADGNEPIEDIRIGDALYGGQRVTGVLQFAGENEVLVNYSGIVTTAHHHVLHEARWKRVEDVPEAHVAPFQVPLLYDIDTSDHRVVCPGNRGQRVVYTDYTEVVDPMIQAQELWELNAAQAEAELDHYRRTMEVPKVLREHEEQTKAFDEKHGEEISFKWRVSVDAYYGEYLDPQDQLETKGASRAEYRKLYEERDLFREDGPSSPWRRELASAPPLDEHMFTYYKEFDTIKGAYMYFLGERLRFREDLTSAVKSYVSLEYGAGDDTITLEDHRYDESEKARVDMIDDAIWYLAETYEDDADDDMY